MDRRKWLKRCALGAGGAGLPLLGRDLFGPALQAAAPPAVDREKLTPLRITDVKTILTAPAGIRLVVVKVISGGWASLGGLRPGDLIRSIQDQPIRSIADFKTQVKAIKKDTPRRVKIFVRRRYRTAFVFISPDWSKRKETVK